MSMSIDVSSIVPSARDFQQAIATRRKRLGLLALVDAPDDARALDDHVRGFVVRAPGEATARLSAASKLPILSLATVSAEDDALRARASGVDAVVIDPSLDPKTWEDRAKGARSTRMAALALVTDHDGAKRAAQSSAKSFVIRLYGVEPIASIVALLPAGAQIVAEIPAADEKTLRALVGKVDAAIVAPEMYLSTSFETLRLELDPD